MLAMVWMGATGCLTGRRATTALPLREAPELLGELDARDAEWNTLGLRLESTASAMGKTGTFTLNVRVARDSVIWMSISPALGVEAARVLLTPDSVQVLSKLPGSRFVFQGNYAMLEEAVQAPVSFDLVQDLILGRPLMMNRELDEYVGKVDGEPFEGGSAEDYPLVLGSNSFIPGFEDGLLKVKAGDEKDVEVTFPEDYQAEHLAGKKAVFTCTIKEVKGPKKPKIDDELAKKFGAEDLDGLKTQITDRLEAEYTGASRAVAKRALLDALDKKVKFDLPQSLVDAEAGSIAHQLWHEENPDVEGHDHPEIEPTKDHIKLAERRVKLGLLLADIGQKASVQVSDQEMTQAIMNQARQYPGQERQFFEFVQQNAQFRQQLQAPLFEDKVVDHIFDQAAVKEKEVSKDDLQKAVEALEDE